MIEKTITGWTICPVVEKPKTIVKTAHKWRVGQLEEKRFFIPIKNRRGQEEGIIPITINKLPLFFKGEDGSEDSWVITFHRGKFAVHFPDSIRDVNDWGYYRPDGKKFIKQSVTGMDGGMLKTFLLKKFGRDFTIQIVRALMKPGA